MTGSTSATVNSVAAPRSIAFRAAPSTAMTLPRPAIGPLTTLPGPRIGPFATGSSVTIGPRVGMHDEMPDGTETELLAADRDVLVFDDRVLGVIAEADRQCHRTARVARHGDELEPERAGGCAGAGSAQSLRGGFAPSGTVTETARFSGSLANCDGTT